MVAALARLLDWYRSEALPLWAERGYDRSRGGFHEALGFDGAPAEHAERRVRVQARQIYVFASADRLGWAAGSGDLARAGFDYFLEKACPDGGARGCVHRMSAEGQITDDRRDLYDQAFLMLACSAMWRAFREPRAIELAERTAAFLERDLAPPVGGFLEDDRGTRPRRQNPHMHLFEAFMAMNEATGEPAWRARADRMAALFERFFFDRERGVLREFFADDLSPAKGREGGVIEPGHMAEWVWLLARYERMSSRTFLNERIALLDNAVRLGADPASGFLVDSIAEGESASGKARRLWPQTEYIKALLARSRDGAGTFDRFADNIAASLFVSYLKQPVKGLWCDQFDGAGTPIAKDVPASILYHLFETVQETQSFLVETNI